jgi:hypothetical protein
MLQFDFEQGDHSEIFMRGQAFKTLYVIHALNDYVEASQRSASSASYDGDAAVTLPISHQQALQSGLCLVVKAIGDPEMLDKFPASHQIRIAGAFVQAFVKLFTGMLVTSGSSASFLLLTKFPEASRYKPSSELSDEVLPNPGRLVSILARAEGDMSDASLALVESACTAVLRVGSVNREFWNAVVTSTSFLEILQNFLLKDPRKTMRQTTVELIEDATGPHTQLLTPESGHSTSGRPEASPISHSIYAALTEGLPQCLLYPNQPEEYFRALLYLVGYQCTTSTQSVDVEHLAEVARDLLLKYTCTEVRPYQNC